MADVLNRVTVQLLTSVHTPDFDPGDWIINPDLSAVEGVIQRYWKIVVDAVVEMSAGEKVTADAAALPGEKVDCESYLAVRVAKETGRLRDHDLTRRA